MSRRAQTLLVAWLSVGLGLILILFLPVPYVILTPTTPTDTLGQDPNHPGTPVLKVKGAAEKPTTGHLLLTTVGERSGHVTLGSALLHWVSGPDAVIPRSVEYPPNKSREKVDQEDAQQMVDSRTSAVVAALDVISFPETVIGEFSRASKADGPLRVGDRITAVDGTPITTFEELGTQIGKHAPGDTVQITVLRAGATLTRSVELIENPDKAGSPLLGVSRVNVDISLQDVSGPSAGLMFSLGIIDKLTTGTLTGGKTIAGTGTIDPDGNVGPIGGIQQKLHGAKKAGATYFFVPDENCAEARAAHVSGLTLVKVKETRPGDKLPVAQRSLGLAYSYLQQIGRGDTDVPHC